MQTIRPTRILNSYCLINIQHMKERTNKLMHYTQFTQLSSYSDALKTTQLAFSILLLWNPSDIASEARREDVPLSTTYPGILVTKKGNQKRDSLSLALFF